MFRDGRKKSSGSADILIVSGTITNSQGKAVKEAGLDFYLDGKKMELEKEVITSKAGGYEAELFFPAGSLSTAKVEIEAKKSSYKTSDRIQLDRVLKEKIDEKGKCLLSGPS